jgi:hypothetical protein
LKKRSKKLLRVLASAFPDGLSPDDQRFLVPAGRTPPFFSKKEPLSSFTRLPWAESASSHENPKLAIPPSANPGR